MQRILVIRLGALGDFVLSFGPFAAIRAHHRCAHVALLTTAPFADLAARSPWFDSVLVDERPSWRDLPGMLRLRALLRGHDYVYDLQTSGRSGLYFYLAGRPPWSGIARGCSHPHANPGRDAMHTWERQREQLTMAGLSHFPAAELGWLAHHEPRSAVAGPFALLIPGAAPHRPAKRWPAEHFGELAAMLAGQGFQPVVVGTARDAPLGAMIRDFCPAALDLTGQTTIAHVAALAHRAALAIGNDTGPMHLAAAMGCRCIVLFSGESDPALTAPRGPDGSWPTVLREPNLADLPVARVAAALS